MKSFADLDKMPGKDVVVKVEGDYMLINFDYKKLESVKGEGGMPIVGNNSYEMESIAVRGSRGYSDIVSAIVTDRYPSDKMDAVRLNRELAEDSSSSISEAKRAEYQEEYEAMQKWRARAKEIAKEVVEQLRG